MLDARQILGQGAGTPLRAFGVGLLPSGCSARDGLTNFRDCDLDVLECQLLLVGINLSDRGPNRARRNSRTSCSSRVLIALSSLFSAARADLSEAS
jgi:hypothetical protein